ncbi:autotransporter outer membrane beta-barrel domain-containing protein [Stenotrophomonas sp.]|uniref:autotransporter outer membrane beta-barrel domain-containing protein n=1 Tax=Stenotrophomonas sp. TaxID=69392 RepID=UPI0028A68182|nr:autotransporter outer membrane beta-barrel domain-containing protein [Stenotrophomonas sp.]
MVRSFAGVYVVLAGVSAAAPVMAGDSPADAVGLDNGQAAALFVPRAHDRRGTLTLEDGRNAWTRVVAQRNDADGDSTLLQIGSDVVQSSHVLLGVMVGSGRIDARAASPVSGHRTKARVRGTAVGVYGTWFQQADGAAGAYLDASLQAAQFRSHAYGTGLKEAAHDSRMWLAALEGGYTFALRSGARWPLQLQPQVLLRHADGVEGGMGLRLSTWHEGQRSLLRPYAAVYWLSGDMHDSQMSARHELQAGADLQWGVRWGAWAGLNGQRRGHGQRDLTVQMGVRMAW